jgi:hypothetical protein
MSLLQEIETYGLADCEFNRKLLKRYVIHDNEGGNFGSWSYDNPPNEAEIIDHFKEMSDNEDLGGNEPIPHEAFSLGMISDIWNVEFIPVSDHIKALEAELKDLGSNYMTGMYQDITDQLTTMRGALNE